MLVTFNVEVVWFICYTKIVRCYTFDLGKEHQNEKSLFKKIIAFLISSVLILLNTTFPICAYDASTSEDDTVLEMVQDTDGSYYCIIPCEIEIYSDNTNLVPTPYADCSKQFTGKIEARYYLESHDLTISIIIKRKWGTGLLKSITELFC